MAAPIKFGVGQSVLRKEDDALIRGKGRYTDDYVPQAALRALVLRSPHAHAKFTIDVARARSLAGRYETDAALIALCDARVGAAIVEGLLTRTYFRDGADAG